MDIAKKLTYKNQARQIIKVMKKQNTNGIYFENSKDAVQAICKMIPDRMTVVLVGEELGY